MSECPTCGTHLPDDGPINVAEVTLAVSELRYPKAFWSNPSAYPLSIRGRTIKPVVVSEQGPTTNAYGELPQGETSEIFVVFTVDGAAFKKSGYGDSYGEEIWDGPLKAVKPVEKTVLVYE